MFPENIQTLESNEVDEQHLREILLPEIQLEIDLRNRLAQTVESRIAWATSLQESLLKGKSFLIAAVKSLKIIRRKRWERFCNVQSGGFRCTFCHRRTFKFVFGA